jgi:hypothetical protein
MAQTVENAAVIENNLLVVANAIKDKVVSPWIKREKAFSDTSKGAFKKAAESRLEAAEGVEKTSWALKNAQTEADKVKAESEFAEAIKAFGEGGKLSGVQTLAYELAVNSAKADPIGQTPMSSLGVGLGLGDEESITLFKNALVQAVVWAISSARNEAEQAAAKAAAQAKAKAEVEDLIKPLYEGEEVHAWTDSKSSDEEFLKAGKVLILRFQNLIRAELKMIGENGSGSTARSQAIFDEVEILCSDMEQELSDKALHLRDKEGNKIWGQAVKLQIGTTARKILEACQIKLASLQSKADRTISRLNALKGAAKIAW